MSEDRDFIDSVLSNEPSIEPSPWFRSRVMRRVRATAELPPLAFPWQRFALGIVLAALAIVTSLASADGPATATLHPGVVIPAVILAFLGARLTTRRRAHRGRG